MFSQPVSGTHAFAGLACKQRIVVWDKALKAHTVAHELAHCLLRHHEECAQLRRSPERWRQWGVLRCQQELEAEQGGLLWAARWGGAASR